jgi:hypothetical protein
MTYHNLYTLSDADATRVTPPGAHSGMDITIQNVNEYGYIYLGGEDVSAINYGYRLLPNHAISLELPSLDALYLIAELDDAKAAVLTIGLEN